MPSHRTGLLIIRAWAEHGSAEPLRAHIRVMQDLSSGGERSLTLIKPEEVGQLVLTWLQDVLQNEDGR